MVRYTNDDYLNMIRCYDFCYYNSVAAARRYHELYPDSGRPTPQTILFAVNRLAMNGNVELRRERAANLQQRTRNSDIVINYVRRHPEASVRGISVVLNIPRTIVHVILQQEGYHPFKKLRVQELRKGDQEKRLTFCRWVLQQQAINEEFCANIMFTDECTFKQVGCYNHHNIHHWAIENPRLIHQSRTVQGQYKINAWAGIIGNKIIGPHEFVENLNAETYTSFLVEDLPQSMVNNDVDPTSNTTWFQQDGAPAHTSREARGILRALFPNKIISKYEAVPWPPRSPDLNPLDFYLWGHMKNQIYATPVVNREDLMNRVNNAMQTVAPEMLERTIRNFIKRCQLCVQFEGGHFEHDRRLRTDEDLSDDEESNASSSDSDDPTWRSED